MWERACAVFLESAERVVLSAARILPGVVGLLLVVAGFTALAVVVRVAVRRVLGAAALDRRFHRWNFTACERWLPGGSPTAMLARLAFWAVVVSGVLVGFGVFEPTSAPAMRLLAWVPHAVLAVVVFGAGLGAARFLERATLVAAVNGGLDVARPLSLAVKWIVLVLVTGMALHHAEIGGPLVPISCAIVVGGVVLAAALAVGLGSRDLVRRTWTRSRRARAAAEELHHM